MPSLETILQLLDHWPAWKRLVSLPREVDALKQRIAELEDMLAGPRREFVESCGALFKRKADGTFENVVYCPNCKTNAASIGLPQFDCGKCGWVSAFTTDELPGILAELSKEQSQPCRSR